jgi:phosphoglycolate phosphatase-like HAD superfamily hydrolase
VLARRNLARFFGGIYGNEGSKVANLEHAMAASNCSPSELVFIGDNEMDRHAAEAVGCHFIGILNEFSGYGKTPRHLLRDLTEVHGILQSIGPGWKEKDGHPGARHAGR